MTNAVTSNSSVWALALAENISVRISIQMDNKSNPSCKTCHLYKHYHNYTLKLTRHLERTEKTRCWCKSAVLIIYLITLTYISDNKVVHLFWEYRIESWRSSSQRTGCCADAHRKPSNIFHKEMQNLAHCQVWVRDCHTLSAHIWQFQIYIELKNAGYSLWSKIEGWNKNRRLKAHRFDLLHS